MAIRPIHEMGGSRKRQIDLTGPEGNAYSLMGVAREWAKDLGKSPEEIDAIIEDMKSSDYDHLLEVFDREFGRICDLFQ